MSWSSRFIKGSLTSFKEVIVDSVLFNTAIRIFEPDDLSLETKKTLTSVKAASFSRNYLYTLDTVIHESGHAFLASRLYVNANPCITILEAGQGAYTTFACSRLSSLGKLLGARDSILLVSVAGVTASLIASLLLIACAHYIYTHYPDLAQYLEALSFASCLNSALYAFSALFENECLSLHASHDFISLWAGGFHPLLFACFFVSIPLLLHLPRDDDKSSSSEKKADSAPLRV